MKATTFKQFVVSSMFATVAGSGFSGSGYALAGGDLQVEPGHPGKAFERRHAKRLGVTARSQAVSVKDLDLSVPANVEVFYRRLGMAARDVCDRSERNDILLRPIFEKCVRETLDVAVLDAGSPAISALHLALTHRRVNPDAAMASAH